MVRLKAFFIISFPVNLLFKLADAIEILKELRKVNTIFLHIGRSKVLEVQIELGLVPLA